MKARLATALLCLAGCSTPAPEMALTIRVPADHRLMAAITQLNLSAARGAVVLAQQSFPATTSTIGLSGVSHGAGTVITLEGVDSAGNVIARGRTCPVDFETGASAALYFAPTNFFAPTVGAPLTARESPVAAALSDGTVLVVGGAGGNAVLASTELYAPDSAAFTAGPAALAHARYRAQAVELASIGTLITGGLDGLSTSAQPIAAAELYSEAQKQFLPVTDTRLDARVGHRVVALADGRAFLSGGTDAGGAALATTLLILVQTDGTYQVSQGPPLAVARSEHAATVAQGVPMVFGGFDATGQPLDSIETLDLDATTATAPVAHLGHARARATASLLADGSILVVGGVGADGAPLGTAELYNTVTRTTKLYPLAAARWGHSATLLSNGRVLVAGGFGAGGTAIASVELFDESLGFLTERPLTTARGNHVAVPLCDGTVLVVGGAAGAEIYSEPAN